MSCVQLQRLYTILYENIRGMLMLELLDIVTSNQSKYEVQHRANTTNQLPTMKHAVHAVHSELASEQTTEKRFGKLRCFCQCCAQPALELPFPLAVLRNRLFKVPQSLPTALRTQFPTSLPTADLTLLWCWRPGRTNHGGPRLSRV